MLCRSKSSNTFSDTGSSGWISDEASLTFSDKGTFLLEFIQNWIELTSD